MIILIINRKFIITIMTKMIDYYYPIIYLIFINQFQKIIV